MGFCDDWAWKEYPEEFEKLPEEFKEYLEEFEKLPEEFKKYPEEFEKLPEEFDLREIFQERAPHPSALRLPHSPQGEGFAGVRVRGPPGNAG